MPIGTKIRGMDEVTGTITSTACVLCVAVMLISTGFSDIDAQKRPDVRIVSVRRIFHNNEHNAFTDMCRFNGKFFLAFRSCPDGHGVYPTASIIVLSSDDGKAYLCGRRKRGFTEQSHSNNKNHHGYLSGRIGTIWINNPLQSSQHIPQQPVGQQASPEILRYPVGNDD